MLAETFPRVPNVSFFPQNVAAPRKLPKSNWILTTFSFHLLKVNFTWNSSEYLPRKKCDSANERLLVKRRAGGRQLTIVPDITFFTQHHCTDIAPTNTQWEQSKTMFLPTSSGSFEYKSSSSVNEVKQFWKDSSNSWTKLLSLDDIFWNNSYKALYKVKHL